MANIQHKFFERPDHKGTLRIQYHEDPDAENVRFAVANPTLTEFHWDDNWDPPRDPVTREHLPENQAEADRRAQVRLDLIAEYVDDAGRLALRWDSEADDHLRIYGLPQTPGDLVTRYLANRPPVEFDFGLLGLQKTTSLGATDLGDIPLMTYSDSEGNPVCRRQFAFAYSTDADGATELTVTETPGWARNDGTWVDGPSKAQVYSGQRYNEWRDSARKRIFAALKTWLPRVMVALSQDAQSSLFGTVADVPTGEALSGGWLATNHAAPWNLYMETGRKDGAGQIVESLTNDSTAWLGEVVPDGVVPGLASGKTVRELIIESLR